MEPVNEAQYVMKQNQSCLYNNRSRSPVQQKGHKLASGMRPKTFFFLDISDSYSSRDATKPSGLGLEGIYSEPKVSKTLEVWC